MILQNYDSQIKITNDIENYVISALGFLANTFDNTPVYLVCPDTMDKIYPPRKRICLNRECVEKMLKKLADEKKANEGAFDRSRKEEGTSTGSKRITEANREDCRTRREMDEKETEDKREEDIWDKINECAQETVSKTIAIGVYVENPTVVNVEQRPSVFICNERVDDIGNDMIARGSYEPKDYELCFKNLFSAVFLHELTHAYIKTPSSIYSKTWGKLIEESLCNAVAYRQIKNWKARSMLSRFFLSQPLEYTGYSYFQQNTEKFMTQLDNWVKKDVDLSLLYFLFTGYYCSSSIADLLPMEYRKEYERIKDHFCEYPPEYLLTRFFRIFGHSFDSKKSITLTETIFKTWAHKILNHIYGL